MAGSDVRERDSSTVLELLNRGDYLRAFDRALELLDRQPRDSRTQYLAVLSLARAGATHQALAQLDSFRLTTRSHDGPDLALDVAALHARLVKDQAKQSIGWEQQRLAGEAARLYESAAAQGGGAYCSVNAGTMWLLAGNRGNAESSARSAVEQLAVETPTTAEDRFWHAATRAEAALLLGQDEVARSSLADAARESPQAWGNRSVTRRQLALVCATLGSDRSVLAELAVPDVIHYCGHIPVSSSSQSGLSDVQENATVESIAHYLDDRTVGFGFGSLASGADILVAEALLSRGAKLTVVLPFALDDFVATSVVPSGPNWVRRFHDCLSQATNVLYGTSGAYLGDVSLFDYCARIAMGQAIIRATSLAAHVEQLAIWDGSPDDGVGTGANVAAWRDRGWPTTVLPWPGTERQPPADSTGRTSGREVRAILFCDLKGFGSLTDGQMRPFVDQVLAPLGLTLDAFGAYVLDRNTWGDGLHVVLSDVSAAADCALALQATLRSCDLSAAGLPQSLGLRIGAHVGPVFELDDPVRLRSSFYGTQVTRTARIEPRTPVGEVYATASFAALAALDETRRFSCEYVGHVPLAKGFGREPMYVVKRRSGAPG